MKNYQNSFYKDKDSSKMVGAKGFKFRLAKPKDMVELSGYEFNSVTPFLMKNKDLLVVLDQNIADL